MVVASGDALGMRSSKILMLSSCVCVCVCVCVLCVACVVCVVCDVLRSGLTPQKRYSG